MMSLLNKQEKKLMYLERNVENNMFLSLYIYFFPLKKLLLLQTYQISMKLSHTDLEIFF